MVPLNSDGDLVIDLIERLQLPVVLVIRHYLGSINHSILSLEVLEKRGIEVKGIVFSGAPNQASEEAILRRSNAKCIGRIEELPEVTAEAIKATAKGIDVSAF